MSNQRAYFLRHTRVHTMTQQFQSLPLPLHVFMSKHRVKCLDYMALQIEDLSKECLKLRAMRTPFYSNTYKTIMTSWLVYLS